MKITQNAPTRGGKLLIRNINIRNGEKRDALERESAEGNHER
jgi:hypothetical protein